MVAESKRFFEDEGLDVELTVSPALPTFAPGLGRQYDIVFTTPVDLITAASRGLGIAGLAGLSLETEQHPVLATIASKDSGVTALPQLEGKTVGVPVLAGTLYTALQSQLEAAGVDPGSVRFQEVPFPNQADQIAAGRVDAVLSSEPFVGGILAKGHVDLGSPYLAVDHPEAVSTLWATSPDWAKGNARTVQRWRAAMQKANDFIAANPDEAKSILQTALELPPEVASEVRLPEFSTDLKTDDLAPWVDVLQEGGDETPSLDSLVVTG
jgi:NitT/TauT family transport system substrate-binding protein